MVNELVHLGTERSGRCAIASLACSWLERGSGEDLDPTSEQALNKLVLLIGLTEHPQGC